MDDSTLEEIIQTNSSEPPQRVCQYVFNKLEASFEAQGFSRNQGIQFFIANLSEFISTFFQKDEDTEEALMILGGLCVKVDWSIEEVAELADATRCFHQMVVEEIPNVEGAEEGDLEMIQNLLALQFNSCLIQDYHALWTENPDIPVFKELLEDARELRGVMMKVIS